MNLILIATIRPFKSSRLSAGKLANLITLYN